MKPLYRNLFTLFGIIAIVFLLFGLDDGYAQIKANVMKAGFFLPATIVLWGCIYLFNARAFQLIVNSARHDKRISFRHAYKMTLSAFAFNYTTPLGLGGGPYRVMEMAKYIGVPCAMSNVVLSCMMHILGFFLLWATAVVVFIFSRGHQMDLLMWALFGLFFIIFIAALLVFNYGYHNGLIERLYKFLFYVPFVKRPARNFYDKKVDSMQLVDEHTANLLTCPRAFWGSLGYEYLGHIASALEYYIILSAFGLSVTFSDAIIILAFASLMSNVLFFFPMQLGPREGGLALVIELLHISSGGVGVLAAFYTRLRELFWICMGVLLVKVGNKELLEERKN